MKSTPASPPAPGWSGLENPGGWEGAADAALALAAAVPDRAGREAFVEMVRRHQTAVCAVAWSVTGRVGLTDDIAQETFFKAWKQIATLRDPAKLKAWLTRIAHDCAVDALRREKPHAALDDPASAPGLAAAAAACCASASPDKAAADAEEEALVWSSLAALPETLRTPLVLYYREGQSVAAVAAAMDLSEDAVKQRLSRGRQALKSAVESRVENVLGRVRPSALLVVTIAAGIGLLPGPAAVAAGVASGVIAAGSAGLVGSAGSAGSAGGGVAAAASATTAAGAAGAGAGISTFMTATSWLAAAITLAAFLPFGWKARGLAVVSHPGKVPPAQSAAALSDDPFADYPDSQLLATWRRLHAEHGSDAAAMPVLYGLIEAEPDSFRRRALGIALMSEWSAVDPEGAFQNLWTEKKNTEHSALMMSEWLKRSPDQAAAHLLAKLSGAEALATALTKDLAELAPDHFIAVLSALPLPPTPKPGDATYVYNPFPEPSREDFEIFARHDFQAAVDALPLLRGKVLAGAQTTVATLMAEKNPASALDWTRSLNSAEERNSTGETVIRLWAQANPAAALAGLDPARDPQRLADLVLEAAAGKDLAGAISMRLDNAGKFTRNSWGAFNGPLSRKFEADPLGTLNLIRGQPANIQRDLVDNLGWEDSKSEPVRKAWNWLTEQKPEGMAQMLGRKIMAEVMADNPAEGLRLLKALPPEWQLDQYQNSAAFISGLSAAQLENLLNTASPAARIPLLEAAFDDAIRGAIPDFPLWSRRLEELPPEARGGAAGKFAKSLVYTDPQLAVSFAESIPEGAARHAAYYELVGYWTRLDAYDASAWVDSLPGGTGRDVAIAGLLTRLIPRDPEAALTWAASIGNPEVRLQQLSELAHQLAKDAPSKIPDLLNNPILNAADREALRQASSKPSPEK